MISLSSTLFHSWNWCVLVIWWGTPFSRLLSSVKSECSIDWQCILDLKPTIFVMMFSPVSILKHPSFILFIGWIPKRLFSGKLDVSNRLIFFAMNNKIKI